MSNNIEYSMNKISIHDNSQIIIFDDKLCKNKINFDINTNKLYNFINNYCLININKDPYICNECNEYNKSNEYNNSNKNVGYIDYLYYNNNNKYIITGYYYHKIKNHGYDIDEKLKELI
jgi:hypothetical protein